VAPNDDTDVSIRGRVTTPDGVGIATTDLGGDGPDLLLVHATGFCAGVLAPMASHLSGRFHCRAIDLRYHGDSDRPADRDFAWSGFATDVLATVDGLGLDRPLAFGHSCGGAALLLAEERRPGTFRGLYCFEPVVFPGPPAAVPAYDNPLSTGARRRRETFPSRTDAFLNFSSKPPFGGLDPDAIAAYVEDGFEVVPADEGGDGQTVRLRCRRDDEAEVYAHGLTHDAFVNMGRVACPVTLACGAGTDSFGPSFLEADAAQLPDATVEELPGLGHFGPLERPGAVAASVAQALGPLADTPRS
jgi:pimeloyl-ACP methyl ester carboxylesterase